MTASSLKLQSRLKSLMGGLLAERLSVIAPEVRTRNERLLGADFSSVAIHRSALADEVCASLGARGFALGEHVAIRQNVGELAAPAGVAVLAHELAHVVQQRRGKSGEPPRPTPALEALLELEADRAAAEVLAGRPYRCALADDAGLPRAWDLAGHYYTPYLVFMNAGANPHEAYRLSMWCWLPDQVSELDAATVGLDDKGIPSHGTDEWSNRVNYRHGYEEFAGRQFVNHEQYMRVVHKGLHCLTGGNAYQETLRREEIFRNPRFPGLLQRGLALHAFGDSFAHRELGGGASLYKPGYGHAWDGDGPDEPWNEGRGLVYIAYVRHMAELASAYTGRGPIKPIDDIIAALSAMLRGVLVFSGNASGGDRQPGRKNIGVDWNKVSPEARRLADAEVELTQYGCGRHIARVAIELLREPMHMIERDEPLPWRVYSTRHPGVFSDCGAPPPQGVRPADYVFYRMLDCALAWCQPAETLMSGAPLYPVRPPRRVS